MVGMTDEPMVVDRQIVMVDADGNVTDDKAQAVRGEVVETFEDETTRSTMFTVGAESAADA